jgi:hypothetical protein
MEPFSISCITWGVGLAGAYGTGVALLGTIPKDWKTDPPFRQPTSEP